MSRVVVARVVVALVGCAVGCVVGCATRPPPCPTPPAPTAGPPLLWRVQRAGAGAAGPVVWLYGTIHDAGIDAVPPAARAALASSRRFASELGDVEPDREAMRERFWIERGPGLDQRLPVDDWWDLRDTLRGVIREDALRRARPWYALVLLNRKAAPGVVAMDVELGRVARGAGTPIEALETIDAQLDALDAVVTVDDVRDAVRARGTTRCQYLSLQAAYGAADLATLTAMLVIPRTAERMLFARNRAWMPAIERYAAAEGAFVAVGLGHLLGEHGLIALLERAGYVVQRTPAHASTAIDDPAARAIQVE